MLADKELKKWFKEECKKNPEKNYPAETLKELGFKRGQCSKCKTYFWSVNPGQKTCGDANCSGGFKFLGKSPAKYKLGYVETWQKFAKMFEKMGYTPIKRYPCVARWNPTTDFTIASIAAFQPYVVTGEAAPPANPLVIPQFCLRFGDIDNVGITGAHYTGFVMIGQHAFVPPKEYHINKYLGHIVKWLNEGIGLKNEDITFHEDSWAGGGNFGPSMEFFSAGLELGNQVYMQYEQTPSGNRELGIKVLDMGAGHERVPWFTQGKSTSYETTFPDVIAKLKKIAGINKADEKTVASFLPYASYLNVDEVEDVEKQWNEIAKKIGMGTKELKEQIIPMSALYSIAEHSRTLLFAINDGALPSNVGGMYNLRVILRRALRFIDRYRWDIDLADVCDEHAKELKPLYPELSGNLDEVREIINVERDKYKTTKQKIEQEVKKAIGKPLATEQIIELYDSQGISPDLLQEEAEKNGKKITIPDNFYALVAAKHEHKEQESATEKTAEIAIENQPDTLALYFDDYKLTEFKAKVLKITGNNVVLDKTAFYPTSGGQMHDTGMLDGTKVLDIFKQGAAIIHQLESAPKFKQGDIVEGHIDGDRRVQLAQMHTATHIVNAAARIVLGNHINQASAKKDVDKAHLDITHYELVNDEELKQIEQEANKIVKKAVKLRIAFEPRSEAEKKYGMRIYQGGAVPGKLLRIVEIPGIDVESCGGTHLNNTNEAGKILLIKASKVKDGIVRLTFTAGKASERIEREKAGVMDAAAKALDCKDYQVPGRCTELFQKWKQARKGRATGETFKLTSQEKSKAADVHELVKETAETLQTQAENIVKTIERFKKDIEAAKER